jgi:hypothetical protein
MIEHFGILITLIFGAALVAVYIPASIELKKPKDNGPRIIEPPIKLPIQTSPVNEEKPKDAFTESVSNNSGALPLLDNC